MSQCDPLSLLGRTILDAYQVEEFVAEGGCGVVYRAFHKHFRSPIALKVLKAPSGLSREVQKHFWEEFRREAEIQFRLSALTAHVARPFHIGKVVTPGRDALPVMALEWLEGMDLAVEMRLRRQSNIAPPSLSELLDRLSGAARAIHLSHNFEREGGKYSVVHRDIKPENLFVAQVRGREVVKVLDFGTSKVGQTIHLTAGDPTNTAHGGQFSPAYAAPEQWVPASLGQCGPWTDVWGMALTLVEMMKGEYVFRGNSHEIMYRCLHERERPTPRQHGLEVSDAVDTAFERALAVDPKQRTKTIRQLWVELRAAVNEGAGATPQSFGIKESLPVYEVSDSELPFIVSPASNRERPQPPTTGTFPVLSKVSARTARDTLRCTGTDGTVRDTLREAAPLSDER